MAPTIRIDEEVYAWLQSKARPFEDSPNSVLRRIASLDSTPSSSPPPVANSSNSRNHPQSISNREHTGRELNQVWRIGASHALYNKEGNWFEVLERFPGALCDPNGYIKFDKRQDYYDCPGIKIDQKTHVKNGISSLPEYVRMKAP